MIPECAGVPDWLLSQLDRLVKLSQLDRLVVLMVRMAAAMRLGRGSAFANPALSVAEESAALKAVVPKVKSRISVRMQAHPLVCVLAWYPSALPIISTIGSVAGGYRNSSDNQKKNTIVPVVTRRHVRRICR